MRDRCGARRVEVAAALAELVVVAGNTDAGRMLGVAEVDNWVQAHRKVADHTYSEGKGTWLLLLAKNAVLTYLLVSPR
jgi:hypothetical protein